MRILIDMQGAQTESRFRGIGRYSTSLAQAMARNAGDHEVWVAVNGTLGEGIVELRHAFDGLVPEQRIQVFEGMRRVGWPDPANAWRRGVAERARESFIAGLQPDVVHVSSLFEGSQDAAVTSIGRLGQGPLTAVTLYDLIPLLNSEVYLSSDWTRNWYMDKVDSLRRADLMLSISEHARREALEALQLDPGRVVNMSSAISPHFKPRHVGDSERDLLESRFGIIAPFVMYSGAMEPRKNADRLLQAFAALDRPLRESTQLLIAGKVAPHDMARFNALASQLGIQEQLAFTGYVTDDELILLYSACSAYVFPSLHEGFGLPALEAMACGAPTIGSSTTSVPEVIGRDDALFDPMDVAAMAASIGRVLTDTAFSVSLREHALRQAARFSWDATAQRAIAAFERLVATRSVGNGRASWPAIKPHLAAQYRGLIDSIAAMPDSDGRPAPNDLAATAVAIARNCERVEHAARSAMPAGKLRWRVEGPFDSSYSLALVNRELALALSRIGHDVALHSTEGPGDFAPDPAFLARQPEISALHERERGMPAEVADVSSRLLYPPRVADMQSRQNLLHLYAWEESGFPQEWMDDFNAGLQGISCLSEHVRKIMVDNGAGVPVAAIGCGVDHWTRVREDTSLALDARKYRFLHVSSCFPRKGADVLLRAYGQAFSDRDDVSLVIKTFKNPHNQVHEWLEQARAGRRDYPHVVVIEDDLFDEVLKGLYARCHALVAPSRAEGFGLPLAEAMLSGLQVVATNWSGHLDFCNEQTAWLVDYDFAPAQSHFNLPLSAWAEPRVDSLAEAMRAVAAASPQLCETKLKAARKLLARRFGWNHIAERLDQQVRQFAITSPFVAPWTGWITSWNTRCGVATYSSHLVDGFGAPVAVLAAEAADRTFDDAANVHRCWTQGEGQDLGELSRRIDKLNLEVLILQFQYSFYDFNALDAFIREQKTAGRTLVVMMHATMDSPLTPGKRLSRLADALSMCDRVLVHAIGDLNRLKRIGVVDNVALFPHGIMDAGEPEPRPSDQVPTIASYGFFLPHKGLHELVEAMGLLKQRGVDVRLRMLNAEYPVPESRAQIERAKALIAELGVDDRISLETGFLRDEDSMAQLVDSDLIVFPYQGTGESASGAVRYGLASGRPVAVTPLPIFDDVGHVVHRLPGTDPQALADGLAALLDAMGAADAGVAERSHAARKWRQAHRYSTLSQRLARLAWQLRRNPFQLPT